MSADWDDAERVLDQIEPVPAGRVVLPPEYLEAVDMIENHPANQSGADKTWGLEALRRDRAFYACARIGERA